MIIVEDYEAIRRAYYLEKKSIRQNAREQHHSRRSIRKAIQQVYPQPYLRTIPKPAPIFGSRFQERVDELLTKNGTLPPKQHYTAHKIYETLIAEGYQGSESWATIKLPPIFVVVDSHNDKSNALLGQASSLAPYL